MESICENLFIKKNEMDSGDTPFIIGCKDRETIDDERWVLAPLSVREARQVYEYLDEYFKK